MIRFLIFLYLYSIIYTFATIKFFFLFSSYIFLQKNLLLLLLHISKSVQFFVKFAHISMEFQLILW